MRPADEIHLRIEDVVRRGPRVAAGFAFASSAIVLGSWLFGVEDSILGQSRMAANSAAMGMLGALALWVIDGRETFARRARNLVGSCALAVSLLAALTLAEHATGVDLGIDALLHHAIEGAPRDRPAPHSAFAHLLLGVALIARVGGCRRVVPDLLALAATMIAIAAIAGHLLDVPTMYAISDQPPEVAMSPGTAAVVICLGIGLLSSRIEHGILAVLVARDQGGRVARWLLVGLVGFFPPIALAVIAGARVGWYSLSFAFAFVLLFAFAEASTFILWTATRLSRSDLETRRVSQVLHDNEELVRILIEQASDGIFVADLDGRYRDVNEAGCRMLGYARSELVGKSILDLIPPEDIPRLARSKAGLLRGEPDIGEWMLRRSDGSYLPVEVSAKILSDGRWQGIVRNITERKQAEAALVQAAETERQLRAELETLNRASSVVSEALADLPQSDLDAVLAAVAEQARELTGAALVAAGVGNDPERPFDHWASVGVSEDAIAQLGVWPRSRGALGDGSRADVIRVAFPRPSDRGLEPPISSLLVVPIKHRRRTIGSLFLANKRDAREFSEHDERLAVALAERVAAAVEMAILYAAEHRQRAWLQSVVDQLPDGVIVLDEHGRVKAINRVMLAYTTESGHTDEWGNPVQFDVRDREGRPVAFSDLPLVRALRDGVKIHDEELQLRHPDRGLVPVAASAGPVHDGTRVGAVLVVRDISERKELERMREEWVAVVAHDLRQPLNAIVLTGDRLASMVADDTGRKVVERMRASAWRLNRLVEDLLDAARIAANRIQLDRRTSDLIALVRVAIENAHLVHPQARLRLVSSDHELAWLDADRIHQVLDNLISNAVKYGTPAAEIVIEVVPRDDSVEVSVISEGPEISPTDLAQLFSRFSRTRHARDSRVPGIGLGLYICKGLVESHGGRIWAESGGGRNAFRFIVPRPPTDPS